jgi:hypothetical protein
LDVHLRGHIVGKVEKLATAVHGHQQSRGTLFYRYLSNRHGIVDGLDGAAQVYFANNY